MILIMRDEVRTVISLSLLAQSGKECFATRHISIKFLFFRVHISGPEYTPLALFFEEGTSVKTFHFVLKRIALYEHEGYLVISGKWGGCLCCNRLIGRWGYKLTSVVMMNVKERDFGYWKRRWSRWMSV